MTKATTKPVAAASAKAAGAAVKPEVKPEASVKPEATAQAPETAKAAEATEAASVNSTAATKGAGGSGDTDAIWVRTKKGVERRCRSGMVFTSVPVLLPVDELTQDQLDAIEADPLLEAVGAPVAETEAVKTAETAE